MRIKKLDELYPIPNEAFSRRVSQVLEKLPEDKQGEGRNKMKSSHGLFTWKKALCIAAAALVLTGSAFAIGTRIKSYRLGWSSTSYTYTECEKIPQGESFEKKYGFALDFAIPEGFSNGYTFDGATRVNNREVYEDGSESQLFYGLDVTYKKGDSEVALNIGRSYEDGKSYTQKLKGDSFALAETFDGIEIYKNEQIMLLVPEDYVMTDEDKALEAEGKYFFSSTSKENFEGENPVPIKQEINCYSAVWSINGVSYELSVFGVNDISTDELVEMAKEMISAE